jgi:hypothetical protein
MGCAPMRAVYARRPVRQKLDEIKAEIDEAERAPFKFMNPARIIGLVRMVWGLLQEIVNHLEKTDGEGKRQA